MYTETLYPETKQVLDKIKNESFLKNFYLAGGTALALQIGHRKSSDLDWFTPDFPKMQILLQRLRKYHITITQTAPGTLDCLLDGTKVSFLEYTYPMYTKLVRFDRVELASVMDIACMKITAVSSRGSKKDFIDLYEILKTHKLSDLFDAFAQKYSHAQYNKMHILKSLTYFDDADSDPDPDFISPINWDEVKEVLTQKAQQYTSSILS